MVGPTCWSARTRPRVRAQLDITIKVGRCCPHSAVALLRRTGCAAQIISWTSWWGEATDEPLVLDEISAREYARPTQSGFGQHALKLRPNSICIVTDLCAFIYLLQNNGGRDHQLVEPEITGPDAQAKPEQLGDIDNRDLIILPRLFVDVLLPQIEIHLAHGATDRDAIGAHAGGHVND